MGEALRHLLPPGAQWSMQVTLGNFLVMLSVLSVGIPLLFMGIHAIVIMSTMRDWVEQLWIDYADRNSLAVSRKLRDKYTLRNGYVKNGNYDKAKSAAGGQ